MRWRGARFPGRKPEAPSVKFTEGNGKGPVPDGTPSGLHASSRMPTLGFEVLSSKTTPGSLLCIFAAPAVHSFSCSFFKIAFSSGCKKPPWATRGLQKEIQKTTLVAGVAFKRGMPFVCWGCHGLRGLNNRQLCSHSSGGQKSKIQVSADLDSLEAVFLGLQMTIFSMCPHRVFFPARLHAPWCQTG